MNISRPYFNQAMSACFGKVVTALQALAFVFGLILFLRYGPWLIASDISTIGRYENPQPPAPSWAKSYAVSHGQFSYFPDSKSSNPTKTVGLLALLGMLIAVEVGCAIWIKRQVPTKSQETEPCTSSRQA